MQLLPEIAIAGRSNVGKSSLLNHLCRQKKLARVSSTPGATRFLNFYEAKGEVSLVDLPGYGYANVARRERRSWGKMVETYLTTRKSLAAMILLVDMRHPVTDDDLQLRDFCMALFDKPTILVMTKADKVSPSQYAKQEQLILDEMQWFINPYITYTVKENGCRDKLNTLLTEWC
mmetsp:Transcript_17778/g.29229  ORF Transcript_17778/g.29229 Transcript_17778/m.29229 type:complete len:175 (+) Transcript_17778:466-990(+)